MKNWFSKVGANLRAKGLTGTARVGWFYVRHKAFGNEKNLKRQLVKYVKLHNRAYKKISSLAISLNKGVHPKHEILRYDRFFLDNIQAGDTILDAGCGQGQVAYALADKAARVIGVDIDQKNIENCKNKFQRGNLEFVPADLNSYEPPTKFNKIILSNVLEHIENRVALLKKLSILSPTILLRVPLITRDWVTVYKKQMGLEYRLDKTHQIEFSLDELKSELDQSGWEIESYQINWGEFWGVLKAKKMTHSMKKLRKAVLISGKYLMNSMPNNWRLIYVTENANWSTDCDGQQIAGALNRQKLLRAKVEVYPVGYKNKIIHLGALPNYPKMKFIRRGNGIIQTIFHIGEKHWPQVEEVKENIARIAWIHTSCFDTQRKLLSAGIAGEKIKVIPLGVNLNIFKPVSVGDKKLIKEKLNLPQDKIIIGSFQKDGNGWGEGLTPKLIKGPDIFCGVVVELSKKYPLHVLLTGPARGYVKKKLGEAGVPYTHCYLKNYNEIVPYWQALDLYLVTSRIEGGPKAILEAWATGVPLVSTKVGMVPDIARNGENVILTEIEDIGAIIASVEKILNDNQSKERLVANGLNEVQKYSWEKIVARYYNELYLPLLECQD